MQRVQEKMTIGGLAKACGVPTSTLRFYERCGILAPEARTGSNYRSYSAGAVEHLRFIRAAQLTGFSLKDIRQMLDFTTGQGRPCREVASLIRRRRSEVQDRLRELKRVDRKLGAALKSCCQGGADWCMRIEQLKVRKASPWPRTAKETLPA